MSASLFDDPCLRWVTSKYSTPQGQDCVQLARAASQLGVRDSKNPDGFKLALRAKAARRLIEETKKGRLDL